MKLSLRILVSAAVSCCPWMQADDAAVRKATAAKYAENAGQKEGMSSAEQKALAGFIESALAGEDGEEWRKIKWADDVQAALKSAKQSGKPILVVLQVGEFGKAKAQHC